MSMRFARSVSEIQSRVLDLSQRFVKMSDLLKEAGGIYDQLVDIIESLKAARNGVVHELAELDYEYKSLKRSYRVGEDMSGLSDLGYDLTDLVNQWRSLDDQISSSEHELSQMKYDRETVVDNLHSLGEDIKDMNTDVSLLSNEPMSWIAKAIMSPRSRELVGSFSRLFEKTIEDYSQFIKNTPPDQLDQMIEQKGLEFANLVNQIKLAEAEMTKLTDQKGELKEFFSALSSELHKEAFETEKVLVKVKKHIQTKAPSYKQAWLFLLERVDTSLRDVAKKFLDDITTLGEVVKVEATPKAPKASKTASWWDKAKKFIDRVVAAGSDALSSLSNARAELKDFAYELTQIPNQEV